MTCYHCNRCMVPVIVNQITNDAGIEEFSNTRTYRISEPGRKDASK